MKRSLIVVLLAVSVVFAQRGPHYFNKETGKWTPEAYTDSTYKFERPMCLGEGAPLSQATTVGSSSLYLSGTSRAVFYRVSNTTVRFYGLINIEDDFPFVDTLKKFFPNRSLVNDTCLFFVSQRSGVGTKLCSLFVFALGAPITDTLFRCAMPTANGGPDTTIITFETACKDSNGLFPRTYGRDFVVPHVYFYIKAATSNATTNYDIYNLRILTNYRRQ